MTDRVMGPLTKLLTDLVAQLKLLTPSGQNSHSGPPNFIGNDRNGQRQTGFHHGHRWHANGNYHKQVRPNKDCHTDHHYGITFQHNGHHQGSRVGAGTKHNFTKMPLTRIHKIEPGSECDSDCSVMSDPEAHLEEEAEPEPVSSKN